MLCKNNLHELRGPRDVMGAECRGCYDERQSRYGDRRRLAVSLLHKMQDAGLSESDLKADSGFAIGLAWASASANESDLARIEAEHPAMVAKLRRMLAKIEAE